MIATKLLNQILDANYGIYHKYGFLTGLICLGLNKLLHGFLQVWDVVKGEPLVNYRGHSGRVMTVAWSLIDPDVLFSGSDDFTVRPWRISQQVFKEPPIEGTSICILPCLLRILCVVSRERYATLL